MEIHPCLVQGVDVVSTGQKVFHQREDEEDENEEAWRKNLQNST